MSVADVTDPNVQLRVCREQVCSVSDASTVSEGGLWVTKKSKTSWQISFIENGAPASFTWTLIDGSGVALAEGIAHPKWNDACNPTSLITIS